MADKRRDALIQGDTIIKGTILNAGAIDVYGYVEGNIAAQNLRVHEGGRIAGKLKADTAEVRGTLQGEAIVKRLIKITSTGVVEGDIRYGSISLEAGGDLSAELRRCSALGPQDAEDPHCVAVWEENRQRFFGRPARPLSPQTPPGAAAPATPSKGDAR
ncbi:MAG: putative entry exclusion protein TrbK-alt [Hyphomicrobium sp.]|nr:putative entry exclusion protein TrbK-alt [Hyphomicrobium sp.]